MTKLWLNLALLLFLAGCASQERPGSTRLVPFEQEGKWGYKDSQGKVVIGPRFVIAQDFSAEGIAPVVDEIGWAYIDTKGNVVIRPFVFDNGPDYFREGVARFTVDGKFGFFDKSGKIVIKPQFGFALPFSEGLAAICEGCKEEAAGEHRLAKGGRWGFINKQGEISIPLSFEAAESFQDGRARVKFKGQWRLINKGGRVVKDLPIGSATVEQDGTIVLRRSAEGPGGATGDALSESTARCSGSRGCFAP